MDAIEELLNILAESEKDVQEGRVREMDVTFRELRQELLKRNDVKK